MITYTDNSWEWKLNDSAEITVALPALNSDKIIWLALESLKNQIDLQNITWELICFEEYGKSRDIIQSYIEQLPNCVRIFHKFIDPIKDSRIKTGAFKNKYLLIDKWINIAKIASSESKVYVMHATDCYSPPKRLITHWEHFQNKECFLSTQPKGVFYNIINGKTILYNGSNVRKTHLNMAWRTNDIKKLPYTNINRNVDGYVINHIGKFNKNNIFYDDTDNWKYSLDTDGYNNISLHRRKFYNLKKNSGVWILLTPKYCKTVNYDGINIYIPSYILDKLKTLKTS